MASNTRRAAARQRGEEQGETKSQDRTLGAGSRSCIASEQAASQDGQRGPSQVF
jgi:hypothetical protein